jgi:DNA-binding protein YbaB
MAERMRQLSADTERIRADYDRAEATGISPDGSVRAAMRAGRMVSLVIDPGAMDHDNVYLAGQVMAAVRQAEEQAAAFLSARTSPMVAAVEELRDRFR